MVTNPYEPPKEINEEPRRRPLSHTLVGIAFLCVAVLFALRAALSYLAIAVGVMLAASGEVVLATTRDASAAGGATTMAVILGLTCALILWRRRRPVASDRSGDPTP